MKNKGFISKFDYQKEVKLFDYQEDILRTFKEIKERENHKRFYFGLKMGLGKTYLALEFFRRENVDDFFIITKKNLLTQWARNYVHIFKNENFEILDTPKSENIIFENNTPKVYITSYERFKKILNLYLTNKGKMVYTKNEGFKRLNARTFNIILDESQILKSHKSQISKLFLAANKDFDNVLLLSGSVISNNLEGIYTQNNILNNTKVSFWNFIKEYFEIVPNRYTKYAIGDVKKDKLEELLSNFSKYAYFKDTKDIFKLEDINFISLKGDNTEKFPLKFIREKAIFFPKENFLKLLDTPLNITSAMRQFFSGFLYGNKISDKLVRELDNFNENFSDSATISTSLSEEDLATENHTYYFETNIKADILVDKLKDEENYLIFYNFDAELKIIQKIANEAGYQTYIINGKRNDLDKILATKHTKSIILAQSKAASQGIDGLQRDFNNIIWYSLPYSYEEFSQANARLYRLGQNSKVDVYYICSNTLEETIYKNLMLYKSFNNLIFSQNINKFYKDVYGYDEDIIKI